MLKGFREYIETGLTPSVFDEITKSGEIACFYRRDGTVLTGTVINHSAHGMQIRSGGDPEDVPAEKKVSKIEILFVCRAGNHDELTARLHRGKDISIQPDEPPRKAFRLHYIKNKTLFPLMMERTVVLITMLNGMVFRGLVSGFNRYEINMSLKGGVPVTLLRHGVLKAQNKEGRSLLKADQETLQDWKKSPLYER
ncbi:MAG: hypothetical protein MUC65_04335 [Pontiellaceae bacterium]|jgi:sRNA-binding regulator protein Hfq|nr:hypothetical protein [Pontiellaceae bacterium]